MYDNQCIKLTKTNKSYNDQNLLITMIHYTKCIYTLHQRTSTTRQHTHWSSDPWASILNYLTYCQTKIYMRAMLSYAHLGICDVRHKGKLFDHSEDKTEAVNHQRPPYGPL